MHSFDITRFAEGGIIREESFRRAVENFNWKQYQGKRVLIPGCSQMPIPLWAYVMIAAKLSQYADSITFGEVTSPLSVFNREKQSVKQD